MKKLHRNVLIRVGPAGGVFSKIPRAKKIQVQSKPFCALINSKKISYFLSLTTCLHSLNGSCSVYSSIVMNDISIGSCMDAERLPNDMVVIGSVGRGVSQFFGNKSKKCPMALMRIMAKSLPTLTKLRQILITWKREHLIFIERKINIV